MKHFLWAALLWILMGSVMYGQGPTIEIQGLAGAEHWVWLEAENVWLSGDNSATYWKDTYDVSGGNANPDEVADPYPASWVLFQVWTPAVMQNARLYMRYGAYNNYASTVYLDDVYVGSDFPFAHTSDTAYDIATRLDPLDYTALGTLTHGIHRIKLLHPGNYCDRFYDGLLLYEGPNAALRNETVNNGVNEYGPYFIKHPGSLNPPDLGKAVKPYVSFSGLDQYDAYELWLSKDGGAAIPFFSGDVINEPGTYELWVYVERDAYTITAYAGANFKLTGGPAQCGQGAFTQMDGDMNNDCSVALEDLALFASHWLECNDPGEPCFFIP